MWSWLFFAPWIVFGVWWIVRAFSTARTEERETGRQLFTHRAFFAAGTLFFVYPPEAMRAHLWPSSLALVIVALALEVIGVAFAIWAREHLGRLWSGTVTLKEGHHILQTGPYRWARHPIYTGILVGLLGTLLARGNLASVIGYALFVVGIARKIGVEEQMLGERFGAEYAEYRKKVRAIIPFVL